MSTEGPELGIAVEPRDDCTVVSVSGEIDLASQGELRATLHELIVAGQVDLVLDLSAVSFVDSTGLGALISTRRRVHGFQGSLALVIPNDAVMKVFTITGLEKVFAIFPTREEALASLSLGRARTDEQSSA